MERVGGRLVLSATDLVGHLACGHLSSLENDALDHPGDAPRRDDPDLEVARRRGFEHEDSHRQWQADQGLKVTAVASPLAIVARLDGLRDAETHTVAAMASGADVIFQATFLDDSDRAVWRGHADFLHRVPVLSGLGDHSYEPEDTKLAHHVTASAVVQLAHYAEHLERLQGLAPEYAHVVLGGSHERESVRLDEVSAYYRMAKRRFIAELARERSTYPMPVKHCAVCRWNEVCEARREFDDHLSRVAGLSRQQVTKLGLAGVTTLAALSALEGESLGSAGVVSGLRPPVLRRLVRQARLQGSRTPGQPPPVEYIVDVDPGRGLGALPDPSAGDLFYDIEGDPFVGGDGIEYLHGLGSTGDEGEFVFRCFWAHTPGEERRAFEAVIDLITERKQAYPDMHVFHYAPYERMALAKLMGRYGTRETKLDDLVRGEVFVDLYRVVRQGLVIGSPSYSLKKLEPLYMAAREGAITDAGSSIVEYERWIEGGDSQILDNIEAYNRDDVESTWLLRCWLEAQRTQAMAAGVAIERPDQPIDSLDDEKRAEALAEREAVGVLVERLREGRIDPPTSDDSEEVRARWLMAHLLRWHGREDKPEWWRYFERVLRFDEAALWADTEAISGLEPAGEPVAHKSSFIWTYEFDPDQEHKLAIDTSPLDPATERSTLVGGTRAASPGTLLSVDPVAGRLQLRRAKASKAPHPKALVPGRPIPTEAQRLSLQRVAQALLDYGVDGPGPALAARRLLAQQVPVVDGVVAGSPLRRSAESAVDAAIRLSGGLAGSCLPIQGPPGAGKTYTAARIILGLVARGRTVGITANSHAVITHLLGRVVDLAAEQGQALRAMQSTKEGAGVDHPFVEIAKSNQMASALAEGRVDVVAGTSWLFAREDMIGSLHTLVVDEAGQLSLANVVAVAPAAKNLVLVGDPRQLAQPSRGVHPEGVGVSALEHVLAGAATVAPEAGLFLDRTWRLHPDICRFISEQIYDGRLRSEERCVNQRIDEGPAADGTGLRWIGVDHQGNRTSSPEEAEVVVWLYTELVDRGWTDQCGRHSALSAENILVVAPYNAQVNLLASRLPEGARVGTVDRFQGREAPVVIVSMAASSAQDAPRGMEFLYSRNRINVAVSRAQALCVVVASPELLGPHCRTLDQIRLANVLCRYAELATDITERT